MNPKGGEMVTIASSRRRFLAGASTLGAASLVGMPGIAQPDSPPEITKLRIAQGPFICYAPQLLAEVFLRMEGFTEVSYVVERPGRTTADLVFSGEIDMTMDAATEFVYTADGRSSAIALAGIHAGCYELYGNDRVRAVRDLKGKTVSVYALGGADHILLSSMLAYVGMKPQNDVTFIAADESMSAMQLFVEGKADAFLAFAPAPQELRARKIGRVIVNTTHDRPWSQYFCCLVVANREFTAKHPVATKRALRSFLKATDLCAQEPERAARMLVEKGYEPRYEVALEVLKELPYRRWREHHPEDTLRFHALRLHEVEMIKSTPQRLIAQATDWRFLNELKNELKA
jgi:NitT/TauT family transport system substrate-binding protein